MIALGLANEGTEMVVADIDSEQADKLVTEIKLWEALAVKVDVSKTEEVKLTTKATLDEFGKIDILVNNAGGSAPFPSTPFCESM